MTHAPELRRIARELDEIVQAITDVHVRLERLREQAQRLANTVAAIANEERRTARNGH